MKPWLIAYHSQEGQTSRIANHMARHMDADFHDVRTCRFANLTADDLVDPAGIIIGAPIRWGRFPADAKQFLCTHCDLLQRVPSGLFSVSLGAASPKASVRDEVLSQTQQLARQCGWTPRIVGAFAGAINPGELSAGKRLIARWVVRRTLGPHQVNGELTDWRSVHQFVDALVPAIA